MSLRKLELASGHGDQTLSAVQFVLHGVLNVTELVSIRDAGLQFAEGQPVVTSNLAQAAGWAMGMYSSGSSGVAHQEPESAGIVVAAIPPNFHLGYAVFTTAYIDRQTKQVSGAPLRYAVSRNQLALYMLPDTEAARVRIETEVANGYALMQHPRLALDKQYIVGEFDSGPGFQAMMRQLEGTVANLQPLDSDRLERSLMELFVPNQSGRIALPSSAMRGLVMRTAESLILTRLRMMRWQGLSLLGYRFFEGGREARLQLPKDVTEQRARIEQLGRQLASSQLLTGELEWIKTYAEHQLELMKMELDGALLEVQPEPDWS